MTAVAKAQQELTPWKVLEAIFKGDLLVYTQHGEVVRCVALSQLKRLMWVLSHHSHFQFKLLVDMTAVDYPSREHRFEVVYMLMSVPFSMRCRVKALVRDGESVDTVTDLFASANWAERECFDMYGIPFEGHPDLRRLLTDYGFEGHPLRKDFPLTGYTEVRYDDELKRVVSESLERSQDFRAFDFRMAWKPLSDQIVVRKVES